MRGKVSMVVPCYNKEAYIGEMLRSVYNQLWDNIEVILVYDRSFDHTLDVIHGWIPKLEQRGYSVKLLERDKPMGLPAAVRDGMKAMTGDYCCTVDCDDEIMPEYVSQMAGWLDGHPEHEWTVCDYEQIPVTAGQNAKDDSLTFPDSPDVTHLLESYLFCRVQFTAWRYMVRKAYLDRCGVIENYVTEPPVCQEPSLLIPLMAGGGKLKYIPKVLYRYYSLGTGPQLMMQMQNNPFYFSQYTELCRKTLEWMELPSKEKRRLDTLLHLAECKQAFYFTTGFHDRKQDKNEYAEKTAEAVNKLFCPNPGINAQDIIQTGYRPFFQAVENVVMGLQNRYMENPPGQLKGRVIVYGALGWMAKELLPPLLQTPLRPTELWDASAKPGTTAHGLAVVRPKLENLEPQDIVLVLPRKRRIQKEVETQFENCLSHYDVLEYLAGYHFPDMQTNCQICPKG